jgi:uncharacterized protein (TIGR01777 family)
MRVFLAGGTGMIGSRLVPHLRQRGDSVAVLTRRPDAVRAAFADCTIVEGDPMKAGAWMDAVADCEAVINLAGENLTSRRWNEAFKKMLIDSRVQSTGNLVQALARNPRTAAGQPKVLVNGSAIGYYGFCGDEELDETSPAGTDFLARLCQEWEKATHAGEAHGLRVATIRTGLVLGKEAGPLSKLLTPFKMGAGGPMGSGKQWMSWIHGDDSVGILLLALDNPAATGPINGTAPNPVTNKEFGKVLGRVLHRPSFMWTPGFALRVGLGEVADLILTGQRVLPKKALALGYVFTFPTLEEALRDVLK